MQTYKVFAAGMALATLLSASVASAQTASSTAVIPTDHADLGVLISGTGITLDATHSTSNIQVLGLPITFSGAIGGTCTLTNAGATVGTTASDRFSNAVTVPAGQTVTLPVTCTGATPGTYTVSMVTSVIPAIVANTSRSITPHGANNTTVANGTITIGNGGTGSVTGTGTVSTTGNGNGGSVLGTNTGTPNLPSTTTSGSGSAVLGASSGTPNVPNTGDGGAAATNLTILALAAIAAVGGTWALRRYAR